MHEGVKHEIIEDGALGKKVKESGFKMKMVRGEHLIDAVWARDKATLWDALKTINDSTIYSKWENCNRYFLCSIIFIIYPFPIFLTSILIPTESMSTKYFVLLQL